MHGLTQGKLPHLSASSPDPSGSRSFPASTRCQQATRRSAATECIYFNKPWLSTPWLGSLAFGPDLCPACTEASGKRSWLDPKFRDTLGCPQDRLCTEAWCWGPWPCKVAAGRGPAAKCWHRLPPPLALSDRQAIARDAAVPLGTPSLWDDARAGTELTGRRFPRSQEGGFPRAKHPRVCARTGSAACTVKEPSPRMHVPTRHPQLSPGPQGILHIVQTCF